MLSAQRAFKVSVTEVNEILRTVTKGVFAMLGITPFMFNRPPHRAPVRGLFPCTLETTCHRSGLPSSYRLA